MGGRGGLHFDHTLDGFKHLKEISFITLKHKIFTVGLNILVSLIL